MVYSIQYDTGVQSIFLFERRAKFGNLISKLENSIPKFGLSFE